jgi:hypothetical protein
MVAINNCGSFGTVKQNPLNAAGLGFVADVFKSGWNSLDSPYAGDYGLLWQDDIISLLWTQAGVSTAAYQKGAFDVNGPQYVYFTTALFQVTSRGTLKSALWVGLSGSVEMRLSVYFDEADLYIRTSVALVNTGTDTLDDIYCKSQSALYSICALTDLAL